jgi:hypothetical protein
MTKLVFLFLLSVPLTCFSQGYRPGYVVLNNGDTVRGFLKHPFGNPYGFLFKDQHDKKQDFRKEDVQGFHIDDVGLYRNILFFKDSLRHMVRVFATGYLNYYEIQLGVSTDSYYHILQKKGDPTQCWYSSDWLSGFKNRVTSYLSDDSVLCGKIKNGSYKKKNILDIVWEYNSFHGGASDGKASP